LDAAARRRLVETYAELAEEPLLALPAVNEDEVRRRIDVAVMSALGVADDLGTIRKLLSVEPLLMGSRSDSETEAAEPLVPKSAAEESARVSKRKRQ
jgi:hypothetical protein